MLVESDAEHSKGNQTGKSGSEMVVVGLTGSVGTGKSTVAGFFKEMGAYVIDWDELARHVVRPDTEAWREIVLRFGEDVLNDDSTINRQKLAETVFQDREQLRELNRIVHPQVYKEDERITREIGSLDPDAVIIKDIPLLYEVSPPVSLDKTVVVAASEQTQLQRLEERGMSQEEAEKRIRSQLPIEQKVKSADFVINNDGPPEETRKQVQAIYALLKKGE